MFIKHLLLLFKRPLRLQTGKLKPRDLLCKNVAKKFSLAKLISDYGKSSTRAYKENVAIKMEVSKYDLAQVIILTKWIRTHLFFDPNIRIDLCEISDRKFLVKDGLVKAVYKLAKSVTGTSSKIQEFKIYNKAINDFIYRKRW